MSTEETVNNNYDTEVFVTNNKDYAPVLYLELEDFMIHKHFTLDLVAGITMVKGLNSRGKTALRRAFEVLFYNAHTTKQRKFIRIGAEQFTLRCAFADGVIITRVVGKEKTNYYTMQHGDDMLLDTRRHGASIKLDYDVPEMIANYLGVYREPITKTALNLRGNRDRMLLVETSGGDNDKIMKDALKISELSEAFRLINIDRNKHKVAYNEALVILRSKAQECGTLKTFTPTEAVYSQVKQCLQSLRQQRNLLDTLVQIHGVKAKTLSLKQSIPKELQSVDMSNYNTLSKLSQLAEQISNLTVPTALETIDQDTLNTLTRLNVIQHQVKAINIPNELPKYDLDTTLYKHLKRLHTTQLQLNNAIAPVQLTEITYETVAKLITLRNLTRNLDILRDTVPQTVTEINDILLQTLTTLNSHRHNIQLAKQKLENLNYEISELQLQIKDKTVCDVCGAIVESGVENLGD